MSLIFIGEPGRSDFVAALMTHDAHIRPSYYTTFCQITFHQLVNKFIDKVGSLRREREKERFTAILSTATTTPVGHARLSRPRAAALAGSGVRKIEGNRGTEWRVDPGVGTGERFSGVRVLVLRGFELNDEFFF